MGTKVIHQEQIDAAHRRLSRHVGAGIIRCMAETDTSVEQIAVFIGTTAAKVWEQIHAFIDGTGTSLEWMSDIALAMGGEWDISIVNIKPIQAPEPTHDAH